MHGIVTTGLKGAGVPPRRRIYTKAEDVDQRLQELDLRQDILLEAVQRGLLARLECTPNHPRTTPGTNAWSETVFRLRELLIPLGWIKSDAANQGLVVNERLGITLNVSGGDERTGNPDLNPSTRNRKGPSMASAVEANSRWLFDEMDPSCSIVGQSSWLLLAYWNPQKQHVQLELSRPVGWGEDERPMDWSERILLPNITHDALPPLEQSAPSEGLKTPEITVEIKRRA